MREDAIEDQECMKDMGKLPPDILVMLNCRLTRLARKLECSSCKEGYPCRSSHADMPLHADFRIDMCRYHEHESEQEKEACVKKWEVLRAKHDIDM